MGSGAGQAGRLGGGCGRGCASEMDRSEPNEVDMASASAAAPTPLLAEDGLPAAEPDASRWWKMLCATCHASAVARSSPGRQHHA